MLNFLRTVQQKIDKKRDASRENSLLHDYMQVSTASVEKYPFEHIVINNVFKEDINKRIRKHFDGILNRGFSQEDHDQMKFHRFPEGRVKPKSEGYRYAPQREEDSVFDIFFSMGWNLLFSNMFKEHTGRCTSITYHHHPAGDRTTAIHSDYGSTAAMPQYQVFNGVILGNNGPDDIQRMPVCKETRTVGLIYYLDDQVWQEGEGGETGLYESKEGSPVKLIAPKNNRLFGFKTNPKSFHAFQQNSRPRSSIVQWFHIPPVA